jgi:hypothetical protein
VDAQIDVLSMSPSPSLAIDVSKGWNTMAECEHHAVSARSDAQDDWEEKISKYDL